MKVSSTIVILALGLQVLAAYATPTTELAKDSKQVNFPNPADFFPDPATLVPDTTALFDPATFFPEVGLPFPFNFFPNPAGFVAIPTGRPEPAGDGLAACPLVLVRDAIGCSCYLTFQVGMPPEIPILTTLTRDSCEVAFGPIQDGRGFCESTLAGTNMALTQAPAMISQTIFMCFNPFSPLRFPVAPPA